MSHKMGANENEQVGQQSPNQRTRAQAAATSRPIIMNPTKQHHQIQKQHQQPRLIKKAYVRFDDYLDLNEENMRRSCKRLMNRLYNKPDNLATTTSNLDNGARSQASTSPPLLPQLQDSTKPICGVENKIVDQLADRTFSVKTDYSTLKPGESSSQLTNKAPAAPMKKSYLRSQYERRQERQMSKIQPQQQHLYHRQQQVAKTNIDELQVGCNNGESSLKTNGTSTGNKSRREQDLVAKSHELSKRRFFEKLERRESMKNSNLGTQNEQQQQQQPRHIRLKSEQITSTYKNGSQAIEARQARERPANKRWQQGGNGKTDDCNEDRLMLKLYQTLASGPRNVTSTSEDTLGGSTGPPPELQVATGKLLRSKAPTSLSLCNTSSSMKSAAADELIGFRTRSQMADGAMETVVGTGREGVVQSNDSNSAAEEPLIEFFKQGEMIAERQRTPASAAKMGGSISVEKTFLDSTTDKSAFEIKVSASELILSSQNPTNGFISSSQLVVKQLGSCGGCSGSIGNGCTSTGNLQCSGKQLVLESGNDLDDERHNSQLMMAISDGQLIKLNTKVVLSCRSSSSSTGEGNKISTIEANETREGKKEEEEEAAKQAVGVEELPLVDGSSGCSSSSTCMQSNEAEITTPDGGIGDSGKAKQFGGKMLVAGNQKQVVTATGCAPGATIWTSISSGVHADREKASINGEFDRVDEKLVSGLETTSEPRSNSANGTTMTSNNKEEAAAKTIGPMEQRHPLATLDRELFEPVAAANNANLGDPVATNHERPETGMAKSIGQANGAGAMDRNLAADVGESEAFEQRQAGGTTRPNGKQDTPTYPVCKRSTAQWEQRGASAELTNKGDDNIECEQSAPEPAVDSKQLKLEEDEDEAASLKTIITDKPAIRDVPPQATESGGGPLKPIMGPVESVSMDAQQLSQASSSDDDVASIAGRPTVERGKVNCNVHPNEAGSLMEEYEEIDSKFTIDFKQAKLVQRQADHVNERRPLVKDPQNHKTEQQIRQQHVGHEQHLSLKGLELSSDADAHLYANPAAPIGNLVVLVATNNVNHDYDQVEVNSPTFNAKAPAKCGNLVDQMEHLSKRQPAVAKPVAGGKDELKPQGQQLRIGGNINQPFEGTDANNFSQPRDRRQLLPDGDITTTRSTSSPRNSSSGIDEDRGSSCSSSGFGASVSATCSSSASTSSSDSNSLKGNNIGQEMSPTDLCTIGNMRMLAPKCHASRHVVGSNAEVHYDTIGFHRTNVTRSEANQSSQKSSCFSQTHYEQLVGPDQAYPSKKYAHPLVVENHGYATLVNRCSLPAQPSSSSLMMLPMRGEFSQEKELKLLSSNLSCSSGHYANLPLRNHQHYDQVQNHGHQNSRNAPTQTVEYATVRTAFAEDKSHSRLAFTRQNSCSEASLSGLSYSTGYSGGFSKLPPVRALDCPSVNNFDYFLGHYSEVALASATESTNNNAAPSSLLAVGSQPAGRQPMRKASLLKRFGSLVSKAFTPIANGAALNPLPTSIQLNETPLAKGASNGTASESFEQKPLRASETQEELAIDSVAQQEGSVYGSKALDNHSDDQDDDRSENADANGDAIDDCQLAESVPVGGQQNLRVAASVIGSSEAVKSTSSMGPKHSIDEADLVILPTKNQQRQKQKQQQPRKPQVISAGNRKVLNNHKYQRKEYDDRLSRGRDRVDRNLRMQMNDTTSSMLSFPALSISSGASLSSSSQSLAYSSLIASPDSSNVFRGGHNELSSSLAVRQHHKVDRKSKQALRRTSSLSEELESLMSYSCIGAGTNSMGNHQRDIVHAEAKLAQQYRPISAGRNSGPSAEAPMKHNQKLKLPKSGRISIDCVSPTKQLVPQHQPSDDIDQRSTASKSRSLLRWFSAATTTSTNATSSSARAQIGASTSSKSLRSRQANCRDGHGTRGKDETGTTGEHHQQLISGLWSLSSQLIEDSHEKNGGDKLEQRQQRKCPDRSKPVTSSAGHQQPQSPCKSSKLKTWTTSGEQLFHSLKQPKSLNIYSSIQQVKQRNDDIHLVNHESDVETTNKCQSLNLYQNLMRNYVTRRHNNRTTSNRHHHHHHHGHDQGHSHNGGHQPQHQQHHHHHHSSNRHHHKRHTHHHHPTRCGCASNLGSACLYPKCVDDKDCCATSNNCSLSSVWGQLIKINKSDGSQVIELQRTAGKSWGFFVARGAINNSRGIFISRMHDDVASSCLAGLLGIGDRILAIDECPIEPDYDILRVNQMISKKSKILLKVKPFKG